DDPDDDWPGDEADDAPGPPWPPGPPGAALPGAAGPPRQGGIRPLVVAAGAGVALAVGAGVAALGARGSPPSSSSSPSSSPSAAQSPGSSQQGGVPGNGGGFPGGGPVGQLLLRGRVVAVSSTSITIAGGGHTVTAAVTSATSVTGKVTSIGSVKV